MKKKPIKEPTTSAGYIANLQKWGCEMFEAGEGEFVVRSSRGGETGLEAEDWDSAAFEAWHLMKP